MRFTLKNALKVISIPLIFLLAYFFLLIIWKYFDLPQGGELIKILSAFINQYGLIIIFIAAFIEGLLLIGNYFPGGVVIFLGVIASIGNIPKAISVILIVCVSFFISYAINYYLGKYGWYKLLVRFGLQSTISSMQKRVSRHMFSAILSSYWLPNLAAICSTAAGIMHIPIKRFLIQSLIGLTAWNIFWGTIVYVTGDALLTLDLIYILLIFCMWCIFIFVKVFIFDKKFNSNDLESIQETGVEK